MQIVRVCFLVLNLRFGFDCPFWRAKRGFRSSTTVKWRKQQSRLIYPNDFLILLGSSKINLTSKERIILRECQVKFFEVMSYLFNDSIPISKWVGSVLPVRVAFCADFSWQQNYWWFSIGLFESLGFFWAGHWGDGLSYSTKYGIVVRRSMIFRYIPIGRS